MKPALSTWLLFASLAHAMQPQAVIDQGPTVNLPSGGGVFLSAKKSVGEGPKLWHVSSIIGFLESDGFPLVGPRDGTYQVELLVLGMVDGRPASSSTACLVTVGSGPAPVPPGPGPNPVPPGPVPPPGPEDRYHLAQVAVNASSGLPAAAKALCPALGDNFAASAAAATSGQITTLVGLNTDIWQRNQKTMGTLKPQFAPLADALQMAFQAAAITDLAGGVQAFKEVSYGLHQVK